jgi:hypothetical protein
MPEPLAYFLTRGNVPRLRWWTERGSKRYLNDDSSLEAAVLHVKQGQ